MFRHVCAAAMVAFLATSLSANDTQERERGERRERKNISEKAKPDPAAKSLTSSDDPGFADTEQGCAGARVLDYLRRHGNDGPIDADALLELTRDEYERRRFERSPEIGPDAIGGTVWTNLGPTNGAGRITAAATHPTVAGTAIIGAAGGGAWKTTNSGATWTPLTEDIANLSVGAIAIAPSATNTVYLGTGEGGYAVDFITGIGLLVSTDGGTNWTLPSSVIAAKFYKMSVLPTNANELVVGTNAGALRSTGGQNGPWTTVIPQASSIGVTGYGDVTDLVRDPSNAQVLYATTWDRGAWCQRFACSHPNAFAAPTVLKSTNGGQTWNPASTGLPVSSFNESVNRMAIAIAPSSPSTLYVATSIYSALTGVETSHIYKTVDGGSSWTETTLFVTPSLNMYLRTQAWYDNTIVVAPSDPSTVIAGGVFYAKTTNGGTTWTSPAFSGSSVHVDAHELRYDAGGLLYICNDGGVWTSPDQGDNVTNRNANLVTRQFYAMANDPANRNRIFGGQQDNGTIRRPDAGGTAWDFFSGGDGFACAINARNPSLAYGTIQFGEVVRASDADAASIVASDVTPRYDSGESVPFFSIVDVDPADPSIVYTVSSRLWKSATGGDAWVPLPITVTGGATWTANTIGALAISRANSQIIMIGKGARVYRTADGGNTWARTDTGLPAFSNVLSLEIHPTDPLTAFTTYASNPAVYYTTNGGVSWTARATGLPLFPAQVVRYDPTDVSALYCGTDVGVYRSTDGGANWSRFGSGLPAVSVYDLEATRDGSLLRAATHGRGIWELNVTGATNNAPAVSLSIPATAQTIAKGASLDFTGTFSDPDGGDSATGSWHFPDDWSLAGATSGAARSHSFHRGGLFPVTLSATDTFGAIGAATVNVTVIESGDACASPVVIPASGPFPYTVTLNTLGSTIQASDPVPVSSCYPFAHQKSIWVSFTPPANGSYNFSLCGSAASAELAGFTGSSCGPYSAAFCLIAPSPGNNCATDSTTTASLTGGVTYRIMLSNYYSSDFGEISLTIAQGANFTPVVNTVSRAVGPSSGGTSVVIHGSGFAGTPTVTFGGTAATNVSVLGVGTLTATTPPHAAGIVDVRVTNPSTAFATLGSGFTYVTAVLAAPASLLATAINTTSVNVNWNTVVGATGYEVLRSTDGTTFTTAGTPAAPPFADLGRTANTSYLYKVRATGPGASSPDSNLDAATTTIFTDDPLVGSSTAIKALHLTQLRTAVNAMRTLAGIGTVSFTDPSLTGVKVKVLHITELRTALNAARADLLLFSLSFTNTLTAGVTRVRALDFTELRNGVK
ncbi:MAG TPA: IPT/TIG domain-containing protein [Thermoanaerobaculia bacterium]|nr:IPT/TIG domain-containing protein [Thermoanaerobaculia bacterium]